MIFFFLVDFTLLFKTTSTPSVPSFFELDLKIHKVEKSGTSVTVSSMFNPISLDNIRFVSKVNYSFQLFLQPVVYLFFLLRHLSTYTKLDLR